LPVSKALAGHAMTRWRRIVMYTSSTAHVRTEIRICAIDTSKPKLTCPKTWTVMMIAATCSRGSVRRGGMTSIPQPRMRAGS
jgi:hypothetical protein